MGLLNPRFTLSAMFGTAVFSTFHFVGGFALMAVWSVSRRETSPQLLNALVGILVNVWWFPGLQVHNLFNIHDGVLNLLIPVANSLVWGAILFAIWQANHACYFRFSLRGLLIGTTLLAVLLGFITYLLNTYLIK